MRPRKSRKSSAPFAYEGLDRIVHEKARLGIMTALLTRPEGYVFNELKELCQLTDGNLSRHTAVLNEAGLVEVFKGSARKRPQTLVRLSRPGRKAFLAYLEELERVILDARDAQALKDTGKPELPPGFLPA